jgi:predicted transcriptional regulator
MATSSGDDALPAFLTVLAILAGLGAIEIADLQARTGLDFITFVKILDALKKPGLVDVSGAPGREKVEITSTGRTLLEASSSKG